MSIETELFSNGGKIESLQSVRALAFLGIFTLHCGIGQFGAWGVSVFVIMSGFLMFYSYCFRDIDSSFFNNICFSIKKIRKLYPLHILMAIATFALSIPFLFREFSLFKISRQIFILILNLLLLQDWVPNADVYFSMNGVSWYLSLCLFLYFAFPFVLKWIKTLNNVKQAFVTSLSVYLIQCIIGVGLFFLNKDMPISDNFQKWVTYIMPVFRLGDFIIGCCWGYIFVNRRKDYDYIICSFCELIALISVFFAVYIYSNQIGFFGSESFRYNMLFTISSVTLVYIFAVNKGAISKILTNKLLVYLGDISAYAFLIHLVVIKYLDAFCGLILGKEINKYCEMAIAFILTVVCCEIFMIIERKFEKAKNMTPIQ